MTEIPAKQITDNDILKDVYKSQNKQFSIDAIDILDLEELKDVQRRKRTEFESYLKRNRLDVKQWMRYAVFEIEQHDMRRARSIFERALRVHISYVPLWIRYIESELKLGYINHARNILERAITKLPRVDKLWYKYLIVEESLAHFDIVRTLFQKWCSLEPAAHVWDSFTDFEVRQERYEDVRNIYSKYVLIHPQFSTWRKWINFEVRYGSTKTVRSVYSLALDALIAYSESRNELVDDCINLIVEFSKWEALQKEYIRSKSLLEIAIQKWPKSNTLNNALLQFEREHGTAETLENTIILNRKKHYEDILNEKVYDYDTWLLYLQLLENNYPKLVMEAFSNVLNAAIPTSRTKDKYWKQYILIWIKYLTFLELTINDIPLCGQKFEELIHNIIPNDDFTFSKIWILYAEFEIRQDNLEKARSILGRSLGLCPKRKTFKYYIDLETKLREFDRVRILYENFLKFDPLNLDTWRAYVEFEDSLGDEVRVRSVCMIPIQNNIGLFSKSFQLHLLEILIDYEMEYQNFDNIEPLLKKQVELSNFTVEAWTDYAMKKLTVPTEEQVQNFQIMKEERLKDSSALDEQEIEFEFEITDNNKDNARDVFERALNYFKEIKRDEDRAKILQFYVDFEGQYGDISSRQRIEKRLPSIVSSIKDIDGLKTQNITYTFPDDENKSNIDTSNILALAHKWKESQEAKSR